MRHEVFQPLATALVAALAASCVMLVNPEQEQGPPPAPEFRKSLDFKPGGTAALEHTLGNVTITGWDKDAAEVVATARTPEPGSERRLQLYSSGDLEPSVDIREDVQALRIRTRSLGGPWTSGGLDYAVRLPNSVNLNPVRLGTGDVRISDVYGSTVVELGRGNLAIKNYSGPLKAVVGGGGADVELLDIRETDVVDITVKEGDIILRLEPDANVRIEAEAPVGGITSDYDLGRELPARAVRTKLGNGAAAITLKALRGNIKILKTA
jgi:hypothetical protein